MICNLDGTWTLESKDIDNLNLIVAKLVTERANDDKVKTFNTEKFVKYIHDLIEKKTGDPQQALTFARQVPFALQITMMSFPDIKDILKGKGYDVSVVDDIESRFRNSLQDVANFIAEQSGSKGVKDLSGQINSITEAERLQPQPVSRPTSLTPLKKENDSDLPYNPLSTTGNELIAGREWYYGFIKKLGNIITTTNGINTNGTVYFEGVDGGVRLSLVKGSIPVNQLYSDDQAVEGIENIIANQFHAIATDANGNYVYFDNNYNVTTEDKGKLVYFPIRTVPSFTVDDNGIRQYNLEEQMGKSVQTIEDRLKKDKTLKRQDVIEEYSLAYDLITDMKNYLNANPGAKLALNITGYDNGTVNYDPNAATPLSALKANYSLFSNNEGTKKGYKYIKVGDNTSIKVSMATYTPEMANNVANLLTGDVIGANGEALSAEQKYQIIRDFTTLGKEGISINTKTGQIYLKGETLDPKAADTKDKIVQFLTRVEVDTTKGKEEKYKNQFSFNEPLYKKNGVVDMFSLTPLGGNKFTYNSNPIPYKEWVSNNAYIKAKVDENGNVRMLNGYIKYEANPITLEALNPKEEVEETPKVVIEQTKPGLSGLNMPLPTGNAEITEAAKAILAGIKLFSMRHPNVSATAKQIADGAKWYDNHEITFKDEKGKTVTKKLVDVIPYEVLFTYANSNKDIRAQFTKNGITLFKGSDSTALYHEAWHGFTQLFMTKQERQTLYNEVKKLAKTINYYNHNTAKWETMNSRDLDFSKRQHILYAEEYLADEFREYAKTQKASSSKLKSFFKYIWNAIKSLFGKSDNASVGQHTTESEILNAAFNELYTGNLINRTYNQENTEFDVLYSGITLNTEEEGANQHLDLDASLAIVESVTSYISDYVDTLNKGALGQPTSAFSINMLYYSELKKLALKHAYKSFVEFKDYLTNKLESAETSIEQQVIEKRLAYVQTAIDNFGDLENLDNNKDTGVIAYYNKRTGFLDMQDATLTEDGADDTFTEENDPETTVEGAATTQLGSTDGTEKSDFQRVDPMLKFVMSTIHKRVPVSEETPDGYKPNLMGGYELADSRLIYNIISSNVEGLNDREAMYKKLVLASQKMTNDVLDPESLMIQQFLAKLGKPTDTSLSVQSLWTALYHSVRYDRIPSMKMIVTKSGSSVSVKVGITDSSFKAVYRSIKDNFQLNNPSKSKFFDADGNVRISVASLKKKYENKAANDIDPVEFFADLGIPITPKLEVLKKIREANLVADVLQYRLKDTRKGLFSKKSKITELKTLDEVIGSENTVFNKLFAIEGSSNLSFSNYMSKTAEDKAKSERSNPSAAGNIVLDLNNATNFEKEVITQPHLAHFNSTINPFVKTSLIFQRMFGKTLTGRVSYKNSKTSIEIVDLSGSQLLKNVEKDVNALVKGVKSSDSDKQTAWLRDFFFTNLYGASEAYRHADKGSAYIAKLVGGDSTTRFYIRPELFAQGRTGNNNSQGRDAANAIITDYIGSELERIKKVIASKNNVSGEKASDIILYGKPGKYTTYADTASKFTVFDGILSDKVKNDLLNSDINTVEDFRKAIRSNPTLKFDIEQDLNAYFNNEIEKDTAALNYYGLYKTSGELSNISRSFEYKVIELRNGEEVSITKTPSIDDLFPSAVENFVYTSFIHRVEMNTLIYGDPALYNHNKDEHMKRVAAFFATGKIPVADDTMDMALANNPGGYAESTWFKTTGLTAPQKGALEGRILSTAVLEDAIEDSAYFDTMVNYAAKLAVKKGQFQNEKDAVNFYTEKYDGYKNMKSADAEAWISFDAYRALEIRLNNWGPRKEQLYRDILAGKDINPDEVAVFFPVKKLQYAGPISTKNLAVNAFHKYSVMPLIPTVIKGTKLEKLHNKMVSQGVAYSVMHSGSKLASLGNNAKLDLFYDKPKGNGQVAFTDPGYTFTKNDIFLQYLKEQLATHDTWHESIKFPTQARKLITSGVMEQGFPVDFETGKSDSKRAELWRALDTQEAKENASPAYALEQRYQRAINKMVKASEEQLRRDLGYSNGKINQQKLVKFIKDNLGKRDVSLYDTEYIKIGSDGKIELSVDLANDPAKIEKLITSLVNKRIVDQLTYGEAYIQGSGIGYERFTKPTDAEQLKYNGTNELAFYRPVDKNGVITDDPKKAVAVLPMQVKVALQGDFLKLLKLDFNGKKIGTIERLNQALKDEKWLATGDNRKMITMGATRIPTASINYIDAMQVAEFLPAEVGNVIILPSEVVAKSGSDFDIDKMIVIRPVIGINKGKVEYTRATEKSKSPKDFQNEILDTWTELILRPGNYTSLTLPNSTDIFEGEGKIVEEFGPINRPESYINSPTKIMQNTYNVNRAVAMSVGKAGIGMLATGATFFNLYKTIGLTMNPDSTVYNSKRTKNWTINNVLRTKHNQVKDAQGNTVISLSNTLDADGKNDIADVITQLMNGYLDVAKNDWVFDINATKEFEPELEFMIMAGVPVRTAVSLLSQPMVRQYLEIVQRYNGIFPLAKDQITNPNFAKYQAAIDVLAEHAPDMATYINAKGEVVSKPTGEILSLAQEFLDDNDFEFEIDELKKRAKKGEVTDSYDLAVFLHFLEIQNMAKGNVELKRNLNFDTSKQQSLFEANQKKENLLALSDRFSKESINRLLNDTVLHNFISSDIMNDAISALLPLRGLKSINKFLAQKSKGMSLEPDQMKRYQSDFINGLSSFMFYNYFNTFDPAAQTYKSADLTEATIEKQPSLKFGAYYDQATGKLFVDNYAIDEDYKTKAFTKEGYGLGLTANLPIDIFAGYPELKARKMYRQFVYEREMLRASLPYKTIEYNGEFEIFRDARIRDLNSIRKADEEKADYDLPKLYEEFIRNKALDNTLNVNALLKTDRRLGIYSIADRFKSIVSDNPQLMVMFPVLSTLRIERTGGYSFIKQAVKVKDQDILTSYTGQMMRLMDPAEVIAEREYQKQAIAAFFSKLPIVSFMQSGNDPNSRISMGSIFDQTKTGIPEMLTPALNKFVSELESGNAVNILDKYASIFDRKQASEDEEGKYIPGVLYVNYSADIRTITEAQPETIVGHSGGAAGADTKWDEIGQEFGPIKFKHYYTGERSDKNAPKGNVDITDTPIAVEGASKVAQAAAAMWGYKYKTMKDQRLIRNWAQVANSDAVFAIAPIGKEGDYWGEDMGKKVEERRVLAKDAVQGGTGYAVEMAIQAGKPVYVYNDPNAKAQSDLPKGWYIWDGSKFVAIETPKLTRNFAGIGSRNMSAEAEQAIRDVYTNTFGQPTQAPVRKTYSGKVTSLQPNQIFVFGSNEGSSKGAKPTHGAGSAKIARDKFGAIQGQSRGLQGQSYAIVTKKFYDVEKSSTPQEIIAEIKGLYEYAKQNSDKEFLVSDYSESNLNGYTGQEMADMFNAAGPIPSNIVFNENFDRLVEPNQAAVSNITQEQFEENLQALLKDSLSALEKANTEGEKYILGFHGGPAFEKPDRSKQYTGEFRNENARRIAESMGARYEGQMLFFTDDKFDDLFNYEDAVQWAGRYALNYGNNNPTVYAYLIPIKEADFTDRGIGEVGLSYDAIEQGKYKEVGRTGFTVNTQAPVEVKGINISTKSSDKLGRELTNPNWGAKNIMDIEAEYKANASKIKAPNLNAEEALRYDMNLMYKLQMKKFKAHPELIKEITDRGGVAFLSASEHTVGVKGSRWEGKGTDSNFIKVLIKSYQDSLKNTQAPVTREVEDQSGRKFPGLLKDQRGVTQVLDFETNKPMLAPQVYDESMFVSGKVYDLTLDRIKEVANENPGKLFLFDDFFPTTTGATRTKGVDYSRQAWVLSKGMGISFGIPTLSSGVSTSLPVTDQNYDTLKAQIDEALNGLLEKKRQGVEIVFPSRGLGQSLLGFNVEPTEYVYSGKAPAPKLFVYLSKRLLQDFGYNNPLLNNLTTKTAGVTEMLGKETGLEFVQDYYKQVKAQSITDTDIKEFIKKCKGLS